MNDKLRQCVDRSLRLVRGTFMLPVTGLFDRRTVSAAVKIAAPPDQQDVPSMIKVLERINYRLDSIEEKIDLLLVPIEAVKH